MARNPNLPGVLQPRPMPGAQPPAGPAVAPSPLMANTPGAAQGEIQRTQQSNGELGQPAPPPVTGGAGAAVAKNAAENLSAGSFAPPNPAVAPAAPPATFVQPDPNVQHPSDFVGFSDFAGMNAKEMSHIADTAAQKTQDMRNQASRSLALAQAHSGVGKPVEQTAEYADYLRLSKQAQDDSAKDLAPTGNPYEDALRGIYRPAQTQREVGADKALASSAATRVDQTNLSNMRQGAAQMAPLIDQQHARRQYNNAAAGPDAQAQANSAANDSQDAMARDFSYAMGNMAASDRATWQGKVQSEGAMKAAQEWQNSKNFRSAMSSMSPDEAGNWRQRINEIGVDAATQEWAAQQGK